jgi:hypothetical protein
MSTCIIEHTIGASEFTVFGFLEDVGNVGSLWPLNLLQNGGVVGVHLFICASQDCVTRRQASLGR